MMKKHFLVILLVSVLSCKGEDEKIKEAKKYIELGKIQLSNMEYERAIESFEYVIDNLDPENMEAHYGFVLASALLKKEKIEDLIGKIFSLLIGQNQTLTPQIVPMSTGINYILSSFLNSEIITFLKRLELTLAKIEEHPDFSFRIKDLPIYLGPFNIGSFPGEHDLGEVHSLHSLFISIRVFCQFLISLDYNITNISQVINYSDIISQESTIDGIIRLITFLLNTNINFLNFEPDSGMELFSYTGREISTIFEQLLLLIDYVRNETDDQTDDVLGYTYDELKGEFISLNYLDSTGTQVKVDIPLKQELVDSLTKIKDHIIGTNPNRISWGKDLSPLLATFFYILLQTGTVESIMNFLSIEGTESLKTTIESLKQSGLLTPDFIQGFITTLIPDAIEFDFFTVFNYPKGLRYILPARSCSCYVNCTISRDESNKIIYPLDSFLFEYEWNRQAGEIFAPNGSNIIDSDHFLNLPVCSQEGQVIEGIQNDSILSPFPYVPFLDPSFNKLIYIHPKRAGIGTVDNYILPGLYQLNAFLAKIIKGIMDTI